MKALYSLALAALLLAACKKDDLDPNGLVPATQEGKNTGDFLLNGIAFNPRTTASLSGGKPVAARWDHTNRGQGIIRISLSRQDDEVV